MDQHVKREAIASRFPMCSSPTSRTSRVLVGGGHVRAGRSIASLRTTTHHGNRVKRLLVVLDRSSAASSHP